MSGNFDKSQSNIFINGIDTSLGKYLKKELEEQGYIVHAPTSDVLDISNIEELNAYAMSNEETMLVVVNCESHYNSQHCTEEQYINRIKNLMTFGLWNGSKFIQISSDQVFDGTSSASESSATSPITEKGRVFDELEKFLASGYADYNNFLVLRTSWLYSYDDSESKYELNLSRELSKYVENKESVILPNNIYGRPFLIEYLAKKIPDFFFSDAVGIKHLGSFDFCSLYDFSLKVLNTSDTSKIIPQQVSSTEGYTQDPILGQHTINNAPHDLTFFDKELNTKRHRVEYYLNLIKLDLFVDCYKNKTLAVMPNIIQKLYPMWEFMRDEFINSPNKKQFLIDLESNGKILDYFNSIEEYQIDLQIVDYFFS